LIVSALKKLNRENIHPEQIKHLEQVLSESEDKMMLLNDANLAPAWIKKIILPLINK